MNPQEFIDSNKLTFECRFVPHSLSRNAGEKHPSLNYKVSLFKNGKPVLPPFDYSMGYGHCHADKKIWRDIVKECETGYRATKPKTPDVLYSLITDADVLNCGTFENWAREFGYDSDSRKAFAIYQECLSTALQLKLHIDLDAAQAAFQDY